jgi:hypothetical protein
MEKPLHNNGKTTCKTMDKPQLDKPLLKNGIPLLDKMNKPMQDKWQTNAKQ